MLNTRIACDTDSVGSNNSNSSLAKLNKTKPQISTSFKLNLIIVLIVSLFTKLTIVSVINGGLSAFLFFKFLTHALILFTFLKKHFVCLQLLFVLDVILFFIFILFEFLFLLYKFLLIIVKHKRNESIGFIGIWLMILIAAIDLLILVIVAIVLENYRRPRERFQQLEAKLITVMHNGRLLASSMCKSGSYLLGFVCNNSNENGLENSNSNAMLSNSENGFISTSNQTSIQNSLRLATLASSNNSNNVAFLAPRDVSTANLNEEEFVHFNSLELNTNNSSISNNFSRNSTQQQTNLTLDTTNQISNTENESYLSNNFTNHLNNLLQQQQPLSNTTDSENIVRNENSSSINQQLDQPSVYVRMYQSNLDDDGDPVDGPLHCTRCTVINTENTNILPHSSIAKITSGLPINVSQLPSQQAKNLTEQIVAKISNIKTAYI